MSLPETPIDELMEYYRTLPESFSVVTRVRMLEAYAALRLAKANEALALSISAIVTNPISIQTKTELTGTVNANVKEIK